MILRSWFPRRPNVTAPISRYALAGVRAATTAAQEALIARATEANAWDRTRLLILPDCRRA